MRALSIAILIVLAAASGTGGAAGSEACDPTGVKLATTPDPPTSAERWKIHERIKANLPRAADTVLVGDSLVAGWPTRGTSILKLGVGGDRTQNVLWRLSDLDLRHLAPRLTIVLIGTNNLGFGEPDCAISAGIAGVVERLVKAWPRTQVLVVGVPPRGTSFDFRNDDRLAVNASLAKTYRDDARVSVLDADAAMSCGFVGPCRNYLPDGLHFSDDGYVELQALIEKALGRPVFF